MTRASVKVPSRASGDWRVAARGRNIAPRQATLGMPPAPSTDGTRHSGKPPTLPTINILTLSGDWSLAKRRLKQKYQELTDADLAYEHGREGELVDRILKRSGGTRDEIECFVNEAFKA
jgi:hypothetical protein